MMAGIKPLHNMFRSSPTSYLLYHPMKTFFLGSYMLRMIWIISLDLFGAVWPFGPCLTGRGYADWIRPSYSKTAEQQQSLTVALKQCPLFQGIDAEVPRTLLILPLPCFLLCGHDRRHPFIFSAVLCQLVPGYLRIYRCNWIWVLGLSGLLLFDLGVSQDLSSLVDAMEIMCCLEHQLCVLQQNI